MSKQDVIKRLQDLAEKLSKSQLKREDIRNAGLEHQVRKHFRNISEALKSAGLETTVYADRISTSNDELLSYLKNLTKKLGRIPSRNEIREDGRFTESIYENRFGSLEKAINLIQENLPKKMASNKFSLKDTAYPSENKIYRGKAAEYFITAELLYRGFNANTLSIDEGLDVLAVKNGKSFYFQVKNVYLDARDRVSITVSSFFNNRNNDVFYMFVLLEEKNKSVLILPYSRIHDLIRMGIIDIQDEDKSFELRIKKDGDIIHIYGKNSDLSVDVSSNLNDWDMIV